MVNDELCQPTGVKSNLTSAYHSQNNGLDEQFNQRLQHQLIKFVGIWDLYLNAFLFSDCVSHHDSARNSPFFLVYGRQSGLPVDFNKTEGRRC